MALTEQIANHVQSQLSNAFARNQVFPRPLEQDYYANTYPVSYAPSVVSAPTVITQVVSPSSKTSTTTTFAYSPVNNVNTVSNIVSQNVPPPVTVVSQNVNYQKYPSTNTNYVNGINNMVDGQYNSLTGHSNTLMGSSNLAYGNKNSISGNVNSVSANKAIVKGNMNRVVERDIDINELF